MTTFLWNLIQDWRYIPGWIALIGTAFNSYLAWRAHRRAEKKDLDEKAEKGEQKRKEAERERHDEERKREESEREKRAKIEARQRRRQEILDLQGRLNDEVSQLGKRYQELQEELKAEREELVAKHEEERQRIEADFLSREGGRGFLDEALNKLYARQKRELERFERRARKQGDSITDEQLRRNKAVDESRKELTGLE